MSGNEISLKINAENPNILEGKIKVSEETSTRIGMWIGSALGIIPETGKVLTHLMAIANSWVKDKNEVLKLFRLKNYLNLVEEVEAIVTMKNIDLIGKVQYEEFFVELGEKASKVDKESNRTKFEYYRNLFIRYLTGDEVQKANVKRCSEILELLDVKSIKFLQILVDSNNGGIIGEKDGFNTRAEIEILAKLDLASLSIEHTGGKFTRSSQIVMESGHHLGYVGGMRVEVGNQAIEFINTIRNYEDE